jgi:hypothetical protein
MKDSATLTFLTILLLIQEQEIKKMKRDFARLSEDYARDDHNRYKVQAYERWFRDNHIDINNIQF